MEIGHVKGEHGDAVFAPDRERQVFERTSRCNQGPLPDGALRSIYREIMSASISLQKPLKIAYLGPPATFTHQAARQRFGASVKYLSCDTISDVFLWVEKGHADYGVVPIENSTEGAVTHTLDEFAETPLKITAEIYLPISQHLLASGTKSSIRKIYSKPEVFGQCRRFLQSEMGGVDLIPVSSTARAAEIAASEPGSGALASLQAAETYRLDVIASEVQDMRGNTTRFLVVGRTCGKPTGEDRTSLLFAVQHKVGALHRALSAFSANEVNLCKIESRPNRTKAWEYCFYVDVEGHVDDSSVQRAIEQLAPECAILRILGSYPKTHDMDE
jgi:chorismate mutase/prephenate dehydratase